ncbi:MAG: TIGR01459 family HAD-type hydrolase [Hyphomonadaceae bacterium]
MQDLESLDDLAGRYDALLCDIWGVVHNGRAIYADACAALARWRARGGAVVLISNVPKQRDPIPGQLTRLGAPADAWDAVVTSGDAIRAQLAQRAPGPMYKIGPDTDEILWSGLGLARSDLKDAAFIGISGLNNDKTETPEDYAGLLQEARARDLDLFCANPDIVVQRGERIVWCAGAIARDYAALGGTVIMAGKPYAPIYDLAYEELERLTGAAPNKSRLLAIGDGIVTDLKGANAQGIDALFIASGMHGEALKTEGVLDRAKIDAALASDGVRAAYIMDKLR